MGEIHKATKKNVKKKGYFFKTGQINMSWRSHGVMDQVAAL